MMTSRKSLGGAGLALLAALLFTPSPVSAEESVCLQCHGGQPGHLGEPVPLWRESVHAENAIACQHCHGGDPTDFAMAMSPERGFIGVPQKDKIPDFCGRCHVGVREDYLQSAHGRALGLGGPQCVTCHGSHAVKRATPELINSVDCSRCHEYGRAEEIKGAMATTDQKIAELEAALSELHRVGIDTTKLEGELFSKRNAFHRLFHSVDVEKVRSQTAAFQTELEAIGEKVAEIRSDLSHRKLAGGILVALLLLAGAVALLIRKTYQEEEEGN